MGLSAETAEIVEEEIVLEEAPQSAQAAAAEPGAPKAPEWPRMREDHILGAARMANTFTPWRVYNLLKGVEKDQPFDPKGRLDLKVKNWLREDAKLTYGAEVSRFDGDTSFLGPFHATRPDIVTEPGALACKAGDILLIQTPSKDSYDMTWKAGYDLLVPATVEAKAQIRMSVAGADRTLLWIVSDSGRVSEFRYIDRDDEFIAALKRGCEAVLAAAERGEEPMPDDVDLDDYVLAKAGERGTVEVDAKSELVGHLQAYDKATKELSQLNIDVRNAKMDQDKAKDAFKKAIAAGKGNLKFPDGRTVVARRVDVAEQHRKASSYTRIDVKAAEKQD